MMSYRLQVFQTSSPFDPAERELCPCEPLPTVQYFRKYSQLPGVDPYCKDA